MSVISHNTCAFYYMHIPTFRWWGNTEKKVEYIWVIKSAESCNLPGRNSHIRKSARQSCHRASLSDVMNEGEG